MDIEKLLSEFGKMCQHKDCGLRGGVTEKMLCTVNEELAPFILSGELSKLYLAFDGASRDGLVLGISNFLTLEHSLEVYRGLIEMCESQDLQWPPALFPIGSWNSTYLLVVLTSKEVDESNVLYIDIGSGDLQISLEFGSLTQLMEVLVGVENFARENNYTVQDAFDVLQSQVFPDRFIPGQKGIKSKHGIENSFELVESDTLPTNWFS